jgi:formylmethanofuran dehydrogenase subunit E
MHKEHSHSHGHDHKHGHKHEHEHEHDEASFSDAVKFHGHSCPGLALGYRASEIALEELNIERDEDEELVCVVENDACGIDAIQVVTGCTAGKGNLIFRDHGKHVYTFISRDKNDAVRLSLKSDFSFDSLDPDFSKYREKVMSGNASEYEEMQFERRKEAIINRMFSIPADRIFDIKHVSVEVPEKARIFKTVKCAKCGEMVSESRARVQDGGFVCIPCFNEYSRRS